MNCLKILTCQIEPPRKGIELNLADNTLISSLSKVFNVEEQELLNAYKQEGDLAKVTEKYFVPSTEEKDLTINELIDYLNTIILTTGKGSKEKKEEILFNIFSKLRSGHEAFFLIRFLQVIGIENNSVLCYHRKDLELECHRSHW